MKDPGYRCPGSHVGYPHGKDKHIERAKRAKARLESKRAVDELTAEAERLGLGYK